MSTYIPSDEIKQPSFHADELGFVFTWNGHLLRGIYPDAVSQAKQYFDSGFVDEIVEKRLFPKTWISEYENEQFGLIIEHELIQPVTYATEWNFEMLKDAALLVLEIAQVGQKYGYDMIDCHKLNVMFHHNRPVYVDLGSFIPAPKGSSGWRPFASFLCSYYFILDVWSSRAPQMAKRMMSPHVELSDNDYYAFKYPIYRRHERLMNAWLTISKALCNLVNIGEKQLEGYKKRNKLKGLLVSFTRKAVLLTKAAPSQQLNRYYKKIKRKNLVDCTQPMISDSLEEITIVNVLNNHCISCSSVTIINNIHYNMYEEILNKTNIKDIYSIHEYEPNSRIEYREIKDINVASLCFNLTGGEILLRNKFPENRFASDIVIWPSLKFNNGVFGMHNIKELLKVLMCYSKSKTIMITTNNPIGELIEALSADYHVEMQKEEDELSSACLFCLLVSVQ